MFGCIKTTQVRCWIRWWHHFSSGLGSYVCAEQLFNCGKMSYSAKKNNAKMCLCRGIWRILLRAVDQYPKRWCVLWLPFSLNDHHTSLCSNDQRNLGVLHLTKFDHKRDLVMKSFWPVFVIELSNTDMRLCHKACALLLEWFLVALSHGKVLFSDECAVYCSSLSWNFFGGLNIILITCLRCKTTHHTWW